MTLFGTRLPATRILVQHAVVYLLGLAQCELGLMLLGTTLLAGTSWLHGTPLPTLGDIMMFTLRWWSALAFVFAGFGAYCCVNHMVFKINAKVQRRRFIRKYGAENLYCNSGVAFTLDR